MRPVVTDEVAWSVCLSVTIASPAKTVEPTEMLYEMWTQVGPETITRWRCRLAPPGKYA